MEKAAKLDNKERAGKIVVIGKVFHHKHCNSHYFVSLPNEAVDMAFEISVSYEHSG